MASEISSSYGVSYILSGVQHCPLAIIVHTLNPDPANFKIVVANAAYTALTGFSLDDLQNNNLVSLLAGPDTDIKGWTDSMDTMMLGKCTTGSGYIYSKDHVRHTVRWWSTPLLTNGVPTHTFSVLEEI